MTTKASTLPAAHGAFLAVALARLAADQRLVGVAAGGSYVTDGLDEFSDLDLVIAVEPAAYDEVMTERQVLAAGLGSLLVAFTGEHVGEPRLLICLYGQPLLHVDLKFVRPDDLRERVEDPVVLWERDRRLSAALASGVGKYPAPDLQAIEDRFWVLVHYVATKVGRGEQLEAVDALSFVRYLALGPLALSSRGARPTGVRKLEQIAPDLAAQIAETVAPCAAPVILVALGHAITLYRMLRDAAAPRELCRHAAAEEAAVDYVRTLAAPLFPMPDVG